VAGVTPKQIYQALTAKGASTIQAIGIMANMIAESGLNPESVNNADPNGGSYGLVQQNGSKYASLVTGNPVADMNAQINVLAENGGIAAASGTTGAAAAGNFAANYERCQGCQQGGSEYNSRVANAATVAGWVSSGSWPASAGSASGAGGQAATLDAATSSPVSNSTDPSCAFGLNGGLPVVGSIGVCLVKKTTVRHMAGGLIIAMSTGAMLLGGIILAAASFQRTGALSKAADAAAVVPGGGAAAAGLHAAHSRATRTGAQASAARRSGRAATATAAGKRAQQPSGRHAKSGPNAPSQGRRQRATP
jgi:Phage tail lysozyme